MYNYTKIQGPRFERNYIIARDKKHDENIARHFNRRRKQTASQNSFAYSVHLFQSNQRFSAIEFVDRHVSEKLKIYSFLSFLHKTCVASVKQRFLFPVSTVSARNTWHHDPCLRPTYEEKRLADYESRCLRKRD